MIKNIIIFALCTALLSGGYLVGKTIDRLEASIIALHVAHKKDILKTKIRERGKRALTVLPVAGLLAFGWFEKLEYDEWKQDNPHGTPEQYSRDVADQVYEMAADYYEAIRNDAPAIDPAYQHHPETTHEQTDTTRIPPG